MARRVLARGAMTGVSVLALSLGMAAVLPTSSSLAADTRTVINGKGGGGVILLDDGASGVDRLDGLYPDAADGILASGNFKAGATLNEAGGVVESTTPGDYTISDKIFTNFTTRGGAGSGGGGGLGGVINIDTGANVTLNNVDFTRNTVIGGTGGSDPAVDVGTIDVGVGSMKLPLYAISAFYFDTNVAYDDDDDAYKISSLTLTEAMGGLQPGMRIVLPGTSTVVTINGISPDGTKLTFDEVSVPADLVLGSGTPLQNSGPHDQLQFDSDIGDVQYNSVLLIDGQKTDVKILSVSADGKTVTLSRALSNDEWTAVQNVAPADTPHVGILNLPKVDISQIKSVDGDTITFAGNNGFFKSGMVLSGGEFGTDTVTVESVDYDPATGETHVKVSSAAPANLVSFTATLDQVKPGSDQVLISNDHLFEGMKVSGAGVPPGTTISHIAADGTVTLSNPLSNDVKPTSLSFSGVTGVNNSTPANPVVSVIDASMLAGVKKGMVVSGPGIPAGTTVESVSSDGKSVTLKVPSGSVDPAAVAELNFASATSLGGTMNGLGQTVTGSDGRDGVDAKTTSVLWGDGEGSDGKRGDVGGDGTAGAGATGGQGGNGSSGLQWNPGLVKDVVDTGIDAGFKTAEAASALANQPPDVAESISVALQAAKAYVDLGFKIGELSEWYVDYAAGKNAAGGDGGQGGDGGDGDDFFGGGVGGAGGNGGDAGNTSDGDGGDGGDGGKGGAGGFGGGGGMGGAGGEHGAGVSVADGDGGLGGKAGFGGGKGSNGDGEEGQGGAGFGGAIFVRSGGTLTITGNSLFDSNRAQGGSSTNGGQAGNTAGADLFMMKGSHVAITPGADVNGVDNTVTFNGTIGDDSRESFDEAKNGRGEGADLTIGKGLVVFNGKNTYTGQTIMTGGVLDADDGWGLNYYSNLNFNGSGRTDGASTTSLADNTNAGVLMTSSGYFARQLGDVGSEVQWTGSGGFAAKGRDLVVNLGDLDTEDPLQLVWGGTPGFFTDLDGNAIEDAALTFGSKHADSAVFWLNPIELDAITGQILVTNNGNADEEDDYAVMAGAISGSGGLIVGETDSSFWNGSLFLTGQNSFDGPLDIRSGTLGVVNGGTLKDGVDVKVAGGAKFEVVNSEVDLGKLDGESGSSVVIAGDDTHHGSVTITEASDYNGLIAVHDDASLYLAGAGSIEGATIALAGLFDISQIDDPPGSTSVTDLFGDGTIALGDKTLAVSNASNHTFSGKITGTGAFGVSGGTLNLDFPTDQEINANIFAKTGGTVLMTGGIIDTTGSDQPALSVINGGTVKVTSTTLITPADQPTASVLFDDDYDAVNKPPAYIALNAGTAVQNAGSLLEVTRDGTSPTGDAFAGNVKFVIDNGQTLVGDILDEDAVRTPGMGSTEVWLGSGVNWTGKAVAGDFYAMGGSSAHFNSGSLLDNLTAEEGAEIDLSGNVVILGTFTLHANGLTIPGSSPGTYNPGTFASDDGNYTTWIKFGEQDPEPGEGNDYSQINVAGDFTGDGGVGPGVLGITLQRWNSTQSTPLGDIADLELLKIGGTENAGSDIHLAQRFTQNGHELLLDRRVRDADPTKTVVGTAALDLINHQDLDETEYFDDDSLVVYGLRSIVQDETFGLATLTGTVHQAGIDTLGTFLERRGSGALQSVWSRAGANHTEIGDTPGIIGNTQDIAYGQGGVDLVQMGSLRAGVLGSYTASTSGVVTETGTANLQGNVWSGGVYATWADNGAYVDAIGQYGFGDWTFSPTSASALTITGQTGLAALEAGYRIGDDQLSVTPWSQMVYQATLYDGMDSAWVGDADFVDSSSLYVRGGVRAEGRIAGFSPYVDLSVSYDVNDAKTTSVDGLEVTNGMGGTRVELGAGFKSDISDKLKIWSQVKGAYGLDEGSDVIGYQGQAGVSASW